VWRGGCARAIGVEEVVLEKQALEGSGSAAGEIALFHGTRDEKLFEFWSWIGAENGDLLCQFNYASILRGRRDRYSRLRAIYWMRKAAASNVELADESLREMTRDE
jgi:hypothetical protein